MDSTNIELATQGQHSTEAQTEILETKVLGISGTVSDRSIKTIERAFAHKPGVKEFSIDRENDTVTVTFNVRQTNIPELHELLLRSGYNPPASVDSKTKYETGTT